MKIPIPDLDMGEAGIGATLSFRGSPHWTFIPWSAVFGIFSEDEKEGMLWEEDVPYDYRREPLPKVQPKLSLAGVPKEPASTTEAAETDSPEPPTRLKPALRAVAGGKGPKEDSKDESNVMAQVAVDDPADDPPPSDPPSKKKRELPSWLRVVK